MQAVNREVFKISVIVPFYNTDEYFKKCLDSLVNQTLKELEIILVDDGSTDNSLAIAKDYQQKDKRIKIVEQENKKQGAARNKGMENATGEYIGFVDSDDWVDLDYFEKLYNSAKKYNSDIALGTNVRIGNGRTKKRLNIKEEKLYTSLEDKFDVCNQFNNECPTNKIYKTTFLKENNIAWPEGVFCEDKIFTVKAVYYANSIVSVANINYYYFRNPNSTVNAKAKSHFEKLNDDKNNARKAVLDFLRSKNVAFADKKYWAIKKDIKLASFLVLRTKESVYTKKYLLFGFIPLGERPL